MAKIHQKLHLQHRRHTGKLLHHRHTSYHGLAIVLVLAGAVIIGLNIAAKVTADSLYVYASIPAPVPTSPAVITDPQDGAAIDHAGLTVSGNCPVVTPRVIIGLFVDGVQVGSVACDTSNNFSIPITLTPGSHTLVAKTYTITGDSGPDSDPVHVLYIVPSGNATAPAGNSGNTTNGTGTAGSGSTPGSDTPLSLTIDVPFIVFGPGKQAVWIGSFTGGKLPYRVHINWGDGSFDDYTFDRAGQQQLGHRYTQMHPHDITLTLRSSNGQQITEHFAAVTPYQPPVTGGLFTAPTGSPFGGSQLFGVYGIYLLTLAAFGLLWIRAHRAVPVPALVRRTPARRSQTQRKPGRAR